MAVPTAKEETVVAAVLASVVLTDPQTALGLAWWGSLEFSSHQAEVPLEVVALGPAPSAVVAVAATFLMFREVSWVQGVVEPSTRTTLETTSTATTPALVTMVIQAFFYFFHQKQLYNLD